VEYHPDFPVNGISTKTFFDCTVPWHLRERFKRAEFLEVDKVKWLTALAPWTGSNPGGN
jgi:4-hydroxy-3-polyprenylbenzoate decarboxylase